MIRDGQGNFYSDDTTVGDLLTAHWRSVFNTPTNKRTNEWESMLPFIPQIQWAPLTNPTPDDITQILRST
eukprot:12170958-Prorocentrum_lima.AAC.1